MRRVCFAAATVAATIGFCSVASAADLPTKAPAYKTPVAVPYNWTGWYVGGNVGYARARSDYDLDYSDANAPFGGGSLQTVPRTAGTGSLSRSGAIGGLQVGYNQQFNQLVLGLEADFSFSSLKSSSDFNGNFPNFPGCGSTFCGGAIAVTTSIQNDWIATLRPRLGVAVDRFLVYVTGGLAIGDLKFAQVNTWQHPLFPSGISSDVTSISKVNVGWTIGGGAAYTIDGKWSVRAEYLYTDLGSVSATTSTNILAPAPFTPSTFSHSADFRASTVRVGLDYKFGGPGI